MINACFFDNTGKLHRCDDYTKANPKAKKATGRFCAFCGAPLLPPKLPELGCTGRFYDSADLSRWVIGVLVGFYNTEKEKIEWAENRQPNHEVFTDAEHPWVSQYGYEAFSCFEPGL
jgi:hypothetical protein